MPKKILINEYEFYAMDGVSHLAIVLYIKAIRPYMDYATGLTGWKRGISYQSLSEQAYVEPKQGRHKSKSGSPSRDAVRNAVQELVLVGLLSVVPANKKLVFRLILATVNDSVQNMSTPSAPDMSTPSAPEPKHRAPVLSEPPPPDDRSSKNDMNPTPRVSGTNNITTTTTKDINTHIQNVGGSGGGDFSFIFDKKLSETERKAISNALPTTSAETAQALIDELAGVMQTQDVKSNVSYFVGIVRRFKSGEFVPTAGIAIAERRRKVAEEREEAIKRHKKASIPKEKRTNSEATTAGRAALKALTKKGRK